MYPYMTIEIAKDALAQAMSDVALDFGADALEAAHGDIVRFIARDCPPEVAADLLRREGVVA